MKIRDPMRLAALSYGLVIPLILFSSCRAGQASDGPSIEFTRIPQAEQGGTPRLDTIAGRVIGAQPKQQIVLYARSGSWWIQPFADQPFTGIQPDSSWSNSTHLGTEYAAILVDPEYRPPSVTYMLPAEGDGVVAVAVTRGAPQFWQTWWFRLLSVLAIGFSLLALYRLRLNKLTRQLSVRFEERLAERTRIAQELHDTLLQGFISASMQLHVAVENLPDDSPSKPPLGNVERLMRQVIDEARNAVQGLRSNYSGSLDLEQAFSRVREELAVREQIGFRVIIEGRTRPLHPVIRDEVYRIGREALVNALHIRRDRQGSHQAHNGEAGRQRSHPGGCGSPTPRHHPIVSSHNPSASTQYHESSRKRLQGLGIRFVISTVTLQSGVLEEHQATDKESRTAKTVHYVPVWLARSRPAAAASGGWCRPGALRRSLFS